MVQSAVSTPAMSTRLPRLFLSAEWRALTMLNFAIDPGLLRPHVPRGTELDHWHGVTYASVVGFMFCRTRVFGMPIPGYRDFEELNLRFYVRRHTDDGWRRGVVFVREVVPRRAIALVARTVYNENYFAHPMAHTVNLNAEVGGDVEFRWKLGGQWCSVGAQVQGAAEPITEGSLEEFITEHYFGYVAQKDGGSVEYGVEHPRWRAWRPMRTALEGDLSPLYGPELAGSLARTPDSAVVAEGSQVLVRHGVRVG